MEIGDIVKIQHYQTVNRAGNAILKKTKPSYERISQIYADGDVMVGNSFDVWKIAASTDPRAKFETMA